MRKFTVLWFGQMVSLMGSGLSIFALNLWVYEQAKSITQFALISLFSILPRIIISPFAGVLIDRLNRRWVMIFSDINAVLISLAICILLATNHLEIWHIYFANIISSIFATIQWIAYSTVTTSLVSKHNLSRANGMIQLGMSIVQLISPALSAFLLVSIQLQGIMLLDLSSFIFSLFTLLSVRFPQAKTTASNQLTKSLLLRDTIDAWNYLRKRPGLSGLLIFIGITDFLIGAVSVLSIPLLLSFTSKAMIGSISAVATSGMLVGSILMSMRSGTKYQINTVFRFMLLSGLCIMAAGIRPSIILFTAAGFLFFLGTPFIKGLSQAIFQKKVALNMQGRIFALDNAVTGVTMSLGYVVAGPLADKVFEPLMSANGLLAGSLGKIIGTGTGRGIGLMFIIMGGLTILTTVVAYFYPHLRSIEKELPDI